MNKRLVVKSTKLRKDILGAVRRHFCRRQLTLHAMGGALYGYAPPPGWFFALYSKHL